MTAEDYDQIANRVIAAIRADLNKLYGVPATQRSEPAEIIATQGIEAFKKLCHARVKEARNGR